jgi:hypothetical protein
MGDWLMFRYKPDFAQMYHLSLPFIGDSDKEVFSMAEKEKK